MDKFLFLAESRLLILTTFINTHFTTANGKMTHINSKVHDEIPDIPG